MAWALDTVPDAGAFAREGFPKGEIGRLLALMQEIDHNGLNGMLMPLRQTPQR